MFAWPQSLYETPACFRSGSQQYEKILKLPASILSFSISEAHLPKLQEWQKIQSEEDLFVDGMGRFDVRESYESLIEYQYKLWVWRSLGHQVQTSWSNCVRRMELIVRTTLLIRDITDNSSLMLVRIWIFVQRCFDTTARMTHTMFD